MAGSVRLSSLSVFVVALTFLVTAAYAQIPATYSDKKSSEIFKNVKVLSDIPSDQLLPTMQFITSALGVQCSYCHVEKAFDRDDKEPKQIARRMMRMTLGINSREFEGHQNVTCYSCHRGTPKPLATPPVPDSQPHLLSERVPDAEPNGPDLPKPDQIVQKYVAALGGAEAIARLTSLHAQGVFDAASIQFPVEVFKKSPDRFATITHFPSGDGVNTFNGDTGWILLPGRPLRPMSSAEADAGRMQGDLHLALDLGHVFSTLEVSGALKIGSQDAIILAGNRPGLPPVTMYFDAHTGLLLRAVSYAPSALGMNPTQIDYSDYRNVDGVKIPFHWTSSTPTGRFSIQINTVTTNSVIQNAVFAKPSATRNPEKED